MYTSYPLVELDTLKQSFITESRLRRSCGVKTPLEDTVEKGENAGNQHYFLFPQYVLKRYERKL